MIRNTQRFRTCATRIVVLCVVLISILAFSPHKFYLTKTTIEFNNRTGGYEVTCKLFTDDFERALMDKNQTPLHLGNSNEVTDADQRIEKYITDHLKIQIDQQTVLLRYVGKEVDSDMTFCYFEFFRQQDYYTAKVDNTLLYEVFPGQQNVVDFTANGNTQTAILVKNKSEQIFVR